MSNLLGWIGASGFKSEREIAADPAAWISTAGWSRVSQAGVRVGPDRALFLSAWFAGVRNLAEDIGKSPLITYRRLEGDDRERAPEHFAYRMLKTRPNPLMSSMTFRETLTAWAPNWGRGCAEIVRDGRGNARQLWPIHPSRIIPKHEKGQHWYDVSVEDISEFGEPMRFAPENILHIHGLGDGYDGYSLAQLAAETIGAGLASELQAASYFGNGVRLSGVLEHPGKLSDAAIKNIRESMIQPHQGSQNAWDVLIAEEGMKYSQAPRISPRDAQFLEGRQFTVEDVGRWLRQPQHKLGKLDRSTNNNIEHQGIEYVTDTILSWAVRWEQELEAKVFTGDEDHYAEHNLTALLRGDSVARGEFYKAAILSGWMSPDEVRRLENMNRIPGGAGAKHYMQAQMAPLDLIASGAGLKSASPSSAEVMAALHTGRNGSS